MSGLTPKWSTVIPLISISACLLVTGCGDSNSSKEDPGSMHVIADALQNAEASYIDSNSEILASLQRMESYITDVFESAAGNPDFEVDSSCLPDNVGGRVFEFDGVSYFGVASSQLTDYTARFILYRISNNGAPIASQPIGRYELTCSGSRYTQAELFWGESAIFSSRMYIWGSPAFGFIGNKSDSRTMDFELAMTPNTFLPTDVVGTAMRLPPKIGFNYGRTEGDDSTTILWYGVTRQENETSSQSLNGELFDSTGWPAIRGYALSHVRRPGESGDSIAACIESGTLDSPIFSPPSVGCSAVELSPMLVTEEELQAVSDSYQSIRRFWSVSSDFVETYLSILTIGR